MLKTLHRKTQQSGTNSWNMGVGGEAQQTGTLNMKLRISQACSILYSSCYGNNLYFLKPYRCVQFMNLRAVNYCFLEGEGVSITYEASFFIFFKNHLKFSCCVCVG